MLSKTFFILKLINNERAQLKNPVKRKKVDLKSKALQIINVYELEQSPSSEHKYVAYAWIFLNKIVVRCFARSHHNISSKCLTMRWNFHHAAFYISLPTLPGKFETTLPFCYSTILKYLFIHSHTLNIFCKHYKTSKPSEVLN